MPKKPQTQRKHVVQSSTQKHREQRAPKPVSQQKQHQSVLNRVLGWLDEYGLLVLGGFLLAFIPLYPKLPLFDLIEGYIVRARLEDLLILATGFVWCVQVLRKKIVWRTPLTWIVAAYAVVGALSLMSAVFVTQTVPAEALHIGKSALHYFRYLEYFALFFFLFSAIKSAKHVKILVAVVALTVLAISVYGYGQRNWYWPVYSTMNREFSKGIRLYLTEHARVQSTFGGHYDLAAYLVISLPLFMGLLFNVRKWVTRALLFVTFLSGLWLLIASASRTSFAAFIAAGLFVIFLVAARQASWIRKAWFFTKESFLLGLLTASFMLFFGDSMYERFLQTLEGYPKLHQAYHDTNAQVQRFVNHDLPLALGLKEEQIANVTDKLKVEKPANGVAVDPSGVLVSSDERPVTERPENRDKPSDVYVDVPDIKKVATVSATGEVEYTEVETERTYSANSIRHGLSLGIRLDSLWPQAIRGFLSNPLLGSGYATLNKESSYHFTEAESTDNNFLRTLGETGILGFLTFYGAVLAVMYQSWKAVRTAPRHSLMLALNAGFLAASVGLLLNALYIDVFAASKVAMSYWALAGVVLALNRVLSQAERAEQKTA